MRSKGKNNKINIHIATTPITGYNTTGSASCNGPNTNDANKEINKSIAAIIFQLYLNASSMSSHFSLPGHERVNSIKILKQIIKTTKIKNLIKPPLYNIYIYYL